MSTHRGNIDFSFFRQNRTDKKFMVINMNNVLNKLGYTQGFRHLLKANITENISFTFVKKNTFVFFGICVGDFLTGNDFPPF